RRRGDHPGSGEGDGQHHQPTARCLSDHLRPPWVLKSDPRGSDVVLPLFSLSYPRRTSANFSFRKILPTRPESVRAACDVGPRRGPTTINARSAPLAQTAEHFHGKEGVYGSIP